MSYLELHVRLPERYALSSIQRFHTGEWIVCIHIARPGEMSGLYHSIGQHLDINEAARMAIERCEAKALAPEMKYAPAQPANTLPHLDLGGIKLDL